MIDDLSDMANDPDIQRELAAIQAEEAGHMAMYLDSSGVWHTLRTDEQHNRDAHYFGELRFDNGIADDIDALYGSEPEHPADVRHETANYWRERAERVEAALETVLSFCAFEDDRIELKLDHTAYIAHPSEEGQFKFLIALWDLRNALAKGQGE